MQHSFVYLFIILLTLLTSVYTMNCNSLDNMVTSLTPAVFELAINYNDRYSDIDMVDIDKDKFQKLFLEELKINKTFYQGTLFVEFYFYNVETKSQSYGQIPANGVQIRITCKEFYMFNYKKEYRYEVTHYDR